MITAVVPKLPFINKQDTLTFYVNYLGFTLRSDYGDYLIMDKDSIELHFFLFPKLEPSKSDFMIYLRIDNDIEGLHAEYLKNAQSIRFIVKLETKPWGQKEFSIADPNGTCLTFGQAV
ncbi:MAG: glyoxalase/bleomycin resistance/extradiol dioxygenase family protein [Cytophagales bacterium CG12_big_fil_rev_8_21_14_0_65_40_12]|nr:MAG: glyoxalase/bleomycin resistance/extradiol dioxygenase family protein [Cytophagales bacterium CG12_big_fil_rev_8_21_14_0_65_40_12]PIW03347.1 MAG: glyoxalase/bleomycin resistance/extradiol dioxygenase family protein [Cytophagales bacterium CG17_big_fil_post_rev_8_21_14_2_50_40_13]